MSNRIQTLAWSLPLPTTDKIVLVKLADNASDEGTCYPSWKRIERETSVATSTLSNILKAFEAYDLVTRERRKRRDGANSSNLYLVKIPEFTKDDIEYYWLDDKDSTKDIVGVYVDGYLMLRKAMSEATKTNSLALFMKKYKEAKKANLESIFLENWFNEIERIKKLNLKNGKEKKPYIDAYFETHTSADEVAHTSADEVATIEPSYSFNHHSFLTTKKTDKSFPFSLNQQRAFENLSAEYKSALEAYAKEKDKGVNFEAFVNYHGAKGSKFVNWKMAYNTWVANAKKWAKGKSANNNEDAVLIIQTKDEMIAGGNW